MENYLEIGSALDIKERRERFVYRAFEILPGFLSLATLTFALFFSWLRPRWVAIFIILYGLYWVSKVIYLSFYQVSCFLKMKRYLKIDWQKKLEDFPQRKNIYHLIILPMVKEGWEIIDGTLRAIRDSIYPKENLIVVLAQEERAGQRVKKVAQMAENKYGKCFRHLLVTNHPKDTEGEAIGKGSNVAFAGKEAKEFIQKEKIPKENIIVSTFDVDTKVPPQYFLCLTYNFLTCKHPTRSSFQPIPLYHNNVWEAPAFTRVIATSNTFWQMMQQERPEQLVTYSSHSMPFKIFLEVGYPKNVVTDDSRVFWKCFFKFDGDYRVVPLYYPVSMDVVVAETLFETLVNQYKQQRRWAWGCIEIPYLLFGFLKNKKISFRKKIIHSFVILEGFWSWACASLLILCLGWLPVVLGGKDFNVTLLSYNLPRLVSKIMIFATVGMLCGTFINILFLPPKPKNLSRFKTISVIFQWLFLPLTLIICGSIPALDAQVRLMLGKYLEFWNTPKFRKSILNESSF